MQEERSRTLDYCRVRRVSGRFGVSLIARGKVLRFDRLMVLAEQ